MGYITRSQFGQALSFLGLEASEQEREVLEARFADDKGFNYLHFLQHVDPTEKLDDIYGTKVTKLLSKGDQVAIITNYVNTADLGLISCRLLFLLAGNQ